MKKLEKMLFKGIYENNLRKVALALNLGADVNAKDNGGTSPLHVATVINNIAIVELLISAGADVNAETDVGTTPLNFANSKEMKELLQGVKP